MADLGPGVQSVQHVPGRYSYGDRRRPNSASKAQEHCFTIFLFETVYFDLSLFLTFEDISVREMYRYSKKVKAEFGNDFYNMPVLQFDHIKHLDNANQFKYNTYKAKRKKVPAKFGKESRQRDFELIKKHSKAVPAPWNYELGLKWMKGPNARENRTVMPYSKAKMKKKWKGKNAPLVDEEQEKAADKLKKENKLDMKVFS
jgi:hypothetical protein